MDCNIVRLRSMELEPNWKIFACPQIVIPSSSSDTALGEPVLCKYDTFCQFFQG
jgi:hypothetical protein